MGQLRGPPPALPSVSFAMREEHVARSFIHALHLGDRFSTQSSLRLSLNAPGLEYLAVCELLGERAVTTHQPRLSWAQSVEHNAALAVLKAPADVWIHIFEQHVIQNAKTMGDLEKAVMVLSSVCRTLRHICINTSRLWAIFSVDYSRYSSLFFERCGTAPLRVLFDARYGSIEAQGNNWNNMEKHLCHTKSLLLTFYSNNDDLIGQSRIGALLRQSAPLLHKLRLIARGSAVRRTVPSGSFGQDWERLKLLDLHGLRLDDTGSYPAFSYITSLQYTNFGSVSPTHLTWLLHSLPKLERLGLAGPSHAFDFDSESSPVDVPSTLVKLVLDGVGTEELEHVLPFFSKVPCLEVRPEDDHDHPSLFSQPWNQLKRVNIRWRRSVIEYHTADTLEAEPKLFKAYARRNQIINALSGESARFLTTLLLDEGAWDFLADEEAWTKDRPVLLPNLTTLRMTLENCVYPATTNGRRTDTIGTFARPGFLAVFDMPCLNHLDLVHLSSWTCARVVAGRGKETQPPQPCFCHNNGVIVMSQVVDLLRHLRGVTERRLPQLRMFGVREILDEHPKQNTEAVKQLVTAVEYHVQVPVGYEDEDAEVNSFDGLVIRPRFDDEDPRYRFQ